MLSQEVQRRRTTGRGEKQEGKIRNEEGKEREKLERKLSRELPFSWKERRIGWEIHVGDYGWRLIVGSVGKRVGGWGLGCLIDMKKMKRKKMGVAGQKKMTEVK